MLSCPENRKKCYCNPYGVQTSSFLAPSEYHDRIVTKISSKQESKNIYPKPKPYEYIECSPATLFEFGICRTDHLWRPIYRTAPGQDGRNQKKPNTPFFSHSADLLTQHALPNANFATRDQWKSLIHVKSTVTGRSPYDCRHE